jgi:hypothetical protein
LSQETTKTVALYNAANGDETVIETFDQIDILDDGTYPLNIAFAKLQGKMKPGSDGIYTLLIKDKDGSQNLMKFRILE